MSDLPRLSGTGFYHLRILAGSTRTDFARWLAEQKERSGRLDGPGSVRAVQRIEEESEVLPRYILLLRQYLGEEVFREALRDLKRQRPKDILNMEGI